VLYPERCSGLVYGVPLGHWAELNGARMDWYGAVDGACHGGMDEAMGLRHFSPGAFDSAGSTNGFSSFSLRCQP
jgi:hypothetical protein